MNQSNAARFRVVLVFAHLQGGLATKNLAWGQVFSGTGANSCPGATIVDVPVGPAGNPLTVTIMGDNSPATGPDCTHPPAYHSGPTWWEAFRINQRATVSVDFCSTSPVQDPSYDFLYNHCTIATGECDGYVAGDDGGRGAPYCSDSNLSITYLNLNPGTYRVPIFSDPAVLSNGLGPYVIHISASACSGSCCDTAQLTCADCVEAASCNGANQVYHNGLACGDSNCTCPGSCCREAQQACQNCASPSSCVLPGDIYRPNISCLIDPCFPVNGPDVVVGNVSACSHAGRTGPIGAGTVAVVCDTTSCNKGDDVVDWFRLPDVNHPVILQNLYRMTPMNGSTRFEQIGQSWIKHGYGAENLDDCGLGCQGGVFEQLGIGCSDTYIAFSFEACTTAPKSVIHPYTGAMTAGPSLGTIPNCGAFSSSDESFPSNDHRSHVHTSISHRLQAQDVDLDGVAYPDARFFAEGQYIAPSEYVHGNGNQNNNVSHVELSVHGPYSGGGYVYTEVGSTVSESPALDAWTGATQSLIEPTPMVDGRAYLAWQVTDLGGGQWHYEYAIYNMNFDASVGSLCIPLAPGANITNVGFHAPLNHAPEAHADNYTNDPWTPTITADAIRWDAETFTANPLANAVRFGTLYNFRFDSNLPPQFVNGVAGLFKTGGLKAVALQGPSPASVTDTNGDGIPDVCQPAIPPVLLADPLHPKKTRFVSFTVPPSTVAGANVTALRVKLVSLHHVDPPYAGGPSTPFTSFEGQIRWVGPPTFYLEGSSVDAALFISQLQCSPYYHDWSALEAPWASNMLHVTGSAVVPSSIYEVQNVAASCQGIEANCTAISAVLTMETARWADVDAPYNPPSTTTQPDLGDVSALVNKFKGQPGAPSKSRTLLVGSDTFGNFSSATLSVDLGFAHIAACVDAFKGKPYPHTVEACP